MTRIAVCLAGQSNEVGSGGEPVALSHAGAPVTDRPDASCSAWPALADRLASRGKWLHVKKTAQGTTAIVYSWAGRPLTWAEQNTNYALPGQLLLSDGGIWKAGGTVGTGGDIATVQPTGTSDTTGADGVPWDYLGTPTARETAQEVMREGDSHFDPNGLIAAAYAAIEPMVGFDRKWCFISFGQSDANLLSTRTQFRDAIIAVADYMLERNVKVAIGMSCRAANARYDSDLIPGRNDALAHYTGNGDVVAGANWADLGEQTTNVTAPGVLGFHDSLHMNPPLLRIAGQMWDDAAGALL